MAEPHGDHSSLIHRIEALEQTLRSMEYVTPRVLDLSLEVVREALQSIRKDVLTLEVANSARRTQMYGVMGSIVVALVVLLISSGVLTSP